MRRDRRSRLRHHTRSGHGEGRSGGANTPTSSTTSQPTREARNAYRTCRVASEPQKRPQIDGPDAVAQQHLERQRETNTTTTHTTPMGTPGASDRQLPPGPRHGHGPLDATTHLGGGHTNCADGHGTGDRTGPTPPDGSAKPAGETTPGRHTHREHGRRSTTRTTRAPGGQSLRHNRQGEAGSSSEFVLQNIGAGGWGWGMRDLAPKLHDMPYLSVGDEKYTRRRRRLRGELQSTTKLFSEKRKTSRCWKDPSPSAKPRWRRS